ncbi:hypothetical protein EDB85DRAFT_281709, partial [Lactarius pseudohatsudake]
SCSWSSPPPSCCRHRSHCRSRGCHRQAATTAHRCRCRGRGRFVGVAKLSPFVAAVVLSCSWWSRSQSLLHSYHHRCRHPPLLPSPLSVASSTYLWSLVVVMVVAAQPLPLLRSRSSLPSCHRRIHPATTLIALVAAGDCADAHPTTAASSHRARIGPPDDGGGLGSTFDSGAGSGVGDGGGDDSVV